MEEIEEKVKKCLDKFIMQKINDRYEELEEILTDPNTRAIEVCTTDLGVRIYIEDEEKVYFCLVDDELDRAFQRCVKALHEEYSEYDEKVIDEIASKQFDELFTYFFEYLEEILKEYSFTESEPGRGFDCITHKRPSAEAS
jgi:Mg2+ and Co2+ transporter CorA